MEKEYKIKGIEKILEKVSKEDLAKKYGVPENADFEEVITKSFEKMGIPNNLEIALYIALKPEEIKEMEQEGKSTNPMDIASKYYEEDDRKRALVGMNYRISREISGLDELFFAIDEPIREEDLQNIRMPISCRIGGCSYHGLDMGMKYYEEHKNELEELLPDVSKREAIENYMGNFMDEFENVEFRGGYGPRPEYKETDKIREEKAKNEKVILELTGKISIDELSLKDFMQLKRRLEKEEKDLQRQFEEKFTNRDNDQR